MKKIKDKTPRYRVEYYKDEYNSLRQAILIDLEEDKETDGYTTRFYRSQINPNLTYHYKTLILNKHNQILEEYELDKYGDKI